MTFRRRLLAIAVATLAVGLGVLLVIGNVLLAAGTRAATSDVLRERASAEIAALDTHARIIRVRNTPNDRYLDRYAWVLQDGYVRERPEGLPPGLDARAVALGRAGRSVEVEGPGDVRLRVARVTKGRHGRTIATVVVGTSVQASEKLRKDVLWGSIVLAALVLLTALVTINSALRSALRPIAQMTEDAEDWGAHDLDRRFDLGPPTDEVTGLAATLDHLLTRIAASRRHEQRFASEIAHELRTPLSRMRTRAELALQDGEPEHQEAALLSVVKQVDELEKAVAALIAVARREDGAPTGSADLAAIAASFDGVQLARPAAVPPAEGETEIVRRALAPLVDNALKFGRSAPRLELGTTDGFVEVRVRDDGPGPDPALGDAIFDPGVQARPGDGAGLGLPLARRLARACGGDVVRGDGPGGCFVLRLPRAET